MSRRLLFGWILLIASIIGYPVSALTFAKQEPPTVLALSWGAIVLTALNILLVEEVKEDEE